MRTYFACGYSEQKILVSVLATLDELQDNEPHTEWLFYDPPNDEWFRHEGLRDIRATAFVYGLPHTWIVGDRGEIWRIEGSKLDKGQLPDSGIEGRHLGQPNCIRMIAGKPYVCGFAGQVYTLQGKKWVHMDDGLAEKEGTHKSIDLESIDGTAADDIYVVGKGGLVAHWDGHRWKRIKLRTNAYLASVRCFSKDHVVAVGDMGVFIEFDGKSWTVEQLPDEELSLSDIEVFREQLYIAAVKNLYVRKGRSWQIVRHGLAKKKTDFFKLTTGGGRLWAMGSKRLASFDGKKWQHHIDPDNG